MSASPPRWAERLLSIALAPGERAVVLGDLHEEFIARAASSPERAARWYRRQVRRSLVPTLRRRLGPPPTLVAKGHPMTSIAQDLRLALRMFVRRPLLSAVAVLSLALGIGLSTGVFGLLDAAVLRPLPVRNPDALRVVLEPREQGINHNFTFPGFVAWRDAQQSFTHVAALSQVTPALNRGQGSEIVSGEIVSGAYFDMLGVRLLHGRGLAETDNAPGAPRVAVLTEYEWRRLFGDTAELGERSIRLNGSAFEVVGVTGGGFRGTVVGGDARFFVPIVHQPIVRPFGAGSLLTMPTVSWATVMGRLRPDVTDEQAIAELNGLRHGLAQAAPGTTPSYTIVPGGRGDSALPSQVASPLQLLLGAAALVLLVACANVAGLMLARASDRTRELAVRTALGASRWRVARLLFLESAAIGLAGTALGLGTAQLVAPLAVSLFNEFGRTVTLDVHLNARVALFAAAAGLVATFGAGLAPVFRNWRGIRLSGLSDGARGATMGAGTTRVRRGLVVAQFALTLALVATAALLVRTLANVRSIPTGLDLEHVALVSLGLNSAPAGGLKGHEYIAQVVERTSQLPGVRAAAFGRVIPLGFGGMRMTIAVPGYTPEPDEDMEINFNIVSSGYFETLGIDLVDGRSFRTDHPTPDGPIEVVVNETMARRYWPGRRAVGRTLGSGSDGSGRPMEVVGLARDVKYRNVREAAGPSFYSALAQAEPELLGRGVLHVRTTDEPEAMLGAIRRTAGEVNPLLPIASVTTLADQLSQNVNRERVTMLIGVVLGSAALVLSAVGLFGAMATLVAGRTRELGVRLALGAVPWGIGGLVLRDGLKLAAWGGAIGLGLALWLGRTVQAQLYGVAPFDLVSVGSAFALLVAVAIGAALVPARRAARVDPVVALRVE